MITKEEDSPLDNKNGWKTNTSPGKILTVAYQVIQALHDIDPEQQRKNKNHPNHNNNLKILLVLTRDFGITIQNVIGALKHFQCQPSPLSLVDALLSTQQQPPMQSNVPDNDDPFRMTTSSTVLASGTEQFVTNHQKVSGVVNIGESSSSSSSSSTIRRRDTNSKTESSIRDTTTNTGYLLVTNEDTIRGLHFDQLDIVLIAGRPNHVDEYVHIAGRTGRAGYNGRAITIVPEIQYSSSTSSILTQPNNNSRTMIEDSSSKKQKSHGGSLDGSSHSPENNIPSGSSSSFTPVVTFISSWEKMLDTKFIRIANITNIRKEIGLE
jgi:Helicase conserved C-terminal domain